jgi:hypothetical protein
LLCASVVAAQPAQPESKPAPKTFAQTACDAKGSGVLLRYQGDEGRQAFEEQAQDAYGLDAVEADDSSESSETPGDKPKSKPKPKLKQKPKPQSKVYRLAPGDACQERLERLRAGGGDDLEVTAAPAEPPKTREALEKAFRGAGTLGKLSRMSFSSQADLSKLFDKAQRLGDFKKAKDLALASGSITEAPGGDASAVHAELGPKTDPSGTTYPAPSQLPKLGAGAAPPNPDETEAETPRVYSPNRIMRAVQRASDWTGEAVSNTRDNSRFTFDRYAGGKPVETIGAVTVVGGWAQLPGSGPGFRFVGAGQYGTPRLVADLMAAAADPIADIPGEKPMPIVAISRYGGGHFPPHITHQNGTDVDVALVGYRNGPLDAKALDRNLLFAVSVVEHMKPTYILLDQRRQAELQARAEVLMSQPGLDPGIQARIKAAYPLLFVGTPAPRGKKLFSHVDNHYDHFHIREQAGQIGR